jgi:alkanesulfonate monooxygenase SsuD/methylene tetrahydromethanopterin reductase-like flavin-dependent oxidoreductase (luciferase family)
MLRCPRAGRAGAGQAGAAQNRQLIAENWELKAETMKVGYILPLGERESTGSPPSYAEIRGMALQAEAAGLDSVWVYDHLLYRFPDKPDKTVGIWECWTILSALCEATERVELGMLVMCVPFRNPALLAKMAVTADEVSGGRLILGLGAGWHQPEFDAFGVPFDHLGSRFEEGLKIIAPLLKEGAVDFHGEYYSAPNGAMAPRGPRPGNPPILIASRGPRMLRLTAEYADQWNTAWFGQPGIFKERLADMHAACAETGRDPATLDVTVGMMCVFEDNPDLPESMADPNRAIKGGPQAVADALKAYEELGVAHVICACVPDEASSLEQLAEAFRLYKGN